MTRLFTEMRRKHDPALLPASTRDRWQPIRGGLLNLYLYDYEEFRYEKGHLILRGNNGTGKSRVMALQLPFLFDGHLAASRVEPDADPSKRMEWNLLMGRHSERLGYTWIEFGRLSRADKNGNNGESDGHLAWSSASSGNGRDHHHGQAQRFVTLGCGLSATKGSGMRDPWFFITDQRIGEELFLQSEAGHALSKSALTEAIGDRGRVYTTAKEYRQAVDEKLFGLGRQRYDAMVDLLIQLRKPQLSRQLDEKMLAGVLGEALPPPSEQMVVDVAESFRGLETDRMELTRFRSACEGVDSFLKTYRNYAGIASRRRAADVRQSHNRYESASKELRQAEREHAEAGELLANATTDLRSLEVKTEELNSQIETLRTDPKMRSADAIRQAEDDEKQAMRDLQAAQQEFKTASDRLGQRKTVQAEALQHAETQLKTTRDVYRRSTEIAVACDLKAKHYAAFSSLQLHLEKSGDTSAGDLRTVRREIEEITDKRVKSSEQLKKRNDTLADAERELARAKEDRDDAQRGVEQAIESERSAEQQRRNSVDDFFESYEMWRRDSDELTMPSGDDIATDVDEWSQRVDEASPIANAVRQAELDARERVNVERARLQHRAEALATERSSAEQMVEKLDQGFQEPPPLPIRADAAARAARPGAPFWSLVDFSRSCPPGQRANIEAALEAAGILNAWVTSEGSVLTSDFADVLVSSEKVPDVAADESLQQVLAPGEWCTAADCTVSGGIIAAVLSKIGYGQSESPTWIAPDGRWRNGPLYGCCRKESAQFIGHDAREEQRVRHLMIVRADLQRLEEQAKQLDQQRQSLDGKSTAIARQVRAVPADSAIRAAANAVTFAVQKWDFRVLSG